MQLEEFKIRVPATSANLGPGFDILGLALNQYGYFTFEPGKAEKCTLLQEDGTSLDIPPEKNLIWIGYTRAMERRNISNPPGIKVRVKMDLPISRGFGSSASALVAGVAAANQILSPMNMKPLDLKEELDLLFDLEGHPDNIFPARLGGWILGFHREDGSPDYIKKTPPSDLAFSVIIPAFEVSTIKSRGALPSEFEIEDLKSNMIGVGLWMEYLSSGDISYLKEALQMDRIHEKYRKEKIPGYDEIKSSALELGCTGVTISGSGPGVLVYYRASEEEKFLPLLEMKLKEIGERYNQIYPIKPCRIDMDGLQHIAL
jgi:homoserine kinase